VAAALDRRAGEFTRCAMNTAVASPGCGHATAAGTAPDVHGRARERGSRRAEHLFDLTGVVQVVTREQADHVRYRLDPTLGMHPMVFPLVGRQRLEQREIRLAQHPEELERLARLASVVVTGADPGILIEGL
jgi:hypothetical protein